MLNPFQNRLRIPAPLRSVINHRSVRVKLALLLILGASVPVLAVTGSILSVANQQIQQSLQSSLEKDAFQFGQQLDQLRQDHWAKAITLAKAVNTLTSEYFLDLTAQSPDSRQLNASNHSLRQKLLNQLLNNSLETNFEPNFYLITDAQGRVIAHRVQILADIDEVPRLPPARSAQIHPYPAWKPRYRPVIPSRIRIKDLDIVETALRIGVPLAAPEMVPANILASLQLESQAAIAIQSPSQGSPPSSRTGTYPIENGQSGLVMLAVVPIQHQGQIQGSVVVGTVLNRHYQIVDLLKHASDISGAALFAYHLRISTNLPTPDGQSRAIGVLESPTISDRVLEQRQRFRGKTQFLGIPYQSVYVPLYDHRALLYPEAAKPIGMYMVAVSETQRQVFLGRLQWVGMAIGGGIVLLIGLLAVPISGWFVSPLRRLTHIAQQIGGKVPRSPESLADHQVLSHYPDEIGILARELQAMTQRLHQQFAVIQTSEYQMRQQASTLATALDELKQTQMQLVQTEKMSSLGQLVAGVAHEINNPVSFIYGNVQHARQYVSDLLNLITLYQAIYPTPSPRIQETIAKMDLEFLVVDLPKLLQSMEMGSQRIHDIIKSLRTFSRLDESEFKEADIHDGLDSTLTILHHRLVANGNRPAIQVVRDYDPNLRLIACYPGKLNQVFMNILANAIDTLEEEIACARWKMDTLSSCFAPRIYVRTCRIDEQWGAIHIRDNGSGIPESIQSQLFDPFFTTKPIGKGTGLGLAISYQIIHEDHHGYLSCVSQPEQGTEFTIKIPLCPLSGSESTYQSAVATHEAASETTSRA